ncbi:MAG: phytanoyl-CoA dioxygenase family protein [Granulosicoccus sp.]
MSARKRDKDLPVWLVGSDIDAELERLQAQRAMHTARDSVPHASDIVHQIPVYQGTSVRKIARLGESQSSVVKSLQQEWARVLLDGAGALVIRNAVDDLAMLDEVTVELQAILEEESQGHPVADHFAAAGSNSRIWNAHEKLCMRAPELFARYNANDALALVCRAWLGPAYQITAQVNIVHPGGRAQSCHRDYHMGFQDSTVLGEYPAHVHALSPLLTLQGGIAHSQVPLETGPTQLLPFSQKLVSGYMSVKDLRIQEHFEQHYVQLALDKGDMLFFNPALFHAAGDNDTADQHRFVNLLQVGSAYGRTLEILDRARMSVALYPALQSMQKAGTLPARGIVQAVEACAEGYAFPASLDLEPPVNGLAPASAQAVMLNALYEGLSADDFTSLVHEHQALKRSC